MDLMTAIGDMSVRALKNLNIEAEKVRNHTAYRIKILILTFYSFNSTTKPMIFLSFPYHLDCFQ